MVERDLKIGVSTPGAPESAEQLAAINAELDSTVAAQTANTEATEASAAATKQATFEEIRRQAILDAQETKIRRLTEAQAEAAAAVAAMAAAEEAGGRKYAIAIDAAETAVARLDILQRSMRVAGGPVSPQMVADLVKYDAAVTAATAATGKLTGSMLSAHEMAGLMRGNMLGLEKTLASTAGNASSLVGVFSRLVLPIGAVLGAIAILPIVFESLQKAGTVLGNVITSLSNNFDDEALATKKAGESTEAYQVRVEAAAEADANWRRASVAMAAGLIDQTTNVSTAAAAWQGHLAALHGNIDQYPLFQAQLKAMGITFKTSSEEMKAEAQAFGQVFQAVMKKDGPEAANYFAEQNKAVLDRIISYYEKVGMSVPAELGKVKDAIGLVTKAEKEAAEAHDLRQHFLDLSDSSIVLKAQIEGATKEMGSEALAVGSLSKEIRGQIDDLTKVKTANAEEEASRRKQLDQLNDLAVKYGILHGKFGELAKSKQEEIRVDDLIVEQLKAAQNLLPHVSQAYGELQIRIDATTAAAKKLTEELNKHTAEAAEATRGGAN